jgi:N-acetylglutamate synthase-like GNAT family acetyltransferase
MGSPAKQAPTQIPRFDEKEFYLDEFRGRTLLLSVAMEDLDTEEAFTALASVVRDLLVNDTRVIIIVGAPPSGRSEPLLRGLQRRLGPLLFREDSARLFPNRQAQRQAFAEVRPEAGTRPEATTALLVEMWARLRRAPLFVGLVTGLGRTESAALAQQLASRLRVHKLVLIEPAGGVSGADQKQIAFMDETMLETLLGAGEAEWAGLADRRPLFATVRAALLGGVTSVNLCALAGLSRELFTYTGSGTLFTLADYCTVQPLGIDDYEEVERLITRGQREGLLKLRTPEEVARLLAHGFGATIGAHHLAGICALETEAYTADRAGEIVGLYTITRFKGEGVGNRLIARVLAEARERGLRYVFACTTEERAQGFFERQGFRRADPEEVAAAKWLGYDPQRKAQVHVLRLDL